MQKITFLNRLFLTAIFVCYLGLFVPQFAYAQPGAQPKKQLSVPELITEIEKTKEALKTAKERETKEQENLEQFQKIVEQVTSDIVIARNNIGSGIKQNNTTLFNDGFGTLDRLANGMNAFQTGHNIIIPIAYDVKNDVLRLELKLINLEMQRDYEQMKQNYEEQLGAGTANAGKLNEDNKQLTQTNLNLTVAMQSTQASLKKFKYLFFILTPIFLLSTLGVGLAYRKKSSIIQKISTEKQQLEQNLQVEKDAQQQFIDQLAEAKQTKAILQDEKKVLSAELSEKELAYKNLSADKNRKDAALQQSQKLVSEKTLEDAKAENMRLENEKREQEIRLEAEKSKQREIEKQQSLEVEQEKSKRETALAEERTKQAEMERQTKLESYPLILHTDSFVKRLDELQEVVKGDSENKLLTLYAKLKVSLEAASKIPLQRRLDAFHEVERLNHIETVMDLYSEKIRRVREDDSLDELEQEEKISSWKALRDKVIADLQTS